LAPDASNNLTLQTYDNSDPSNFYWIIMQLTGGVLTPNNQPMNVPPVSSLNSDCDFLLVHKKSRKLADYTNGRHRRVELHSTTIDDGYKSNPMAAIVFRFERSDPFWMIHPGTKYQGGWDTLDIQGADYNAGTAILNWDRNGNDNQRWAFSFSERWPSWG
jgi:hypothetical protein